MATRKCDKCGREVDLFQTKTIGMETVCNDCAKKAELDEKYITPGGMSPSGPSVQVERHFGVLSGYGTVLSILGWLGVLSRTPIIRCQR